MMSRMIDDEEALKDNGLIEIDGCNVAECEYFLFRDKEEIQERSCGVGLVDCEGKDCMYKQLQRAKAELEELKKYKRYKFLFEKAKEMKEQTDKWAKECLKENEDLKDSLKRTVCQAECFRYKETEKYKAENERLKAENEKLKLMTGIYSVRLMEKYKQALKKIEEIAYTTDFDIVDIQEIVDEVLK